VPENAAPTCLDAATVYEDLAFPDGNDRRPYVVVNMVSTADGKAVVDGKASRLGGPLDRQTMRRIRAAADAILNGAATIRSEAFVARTSCEDATARASRGLLPLLRHIVLTSSGDLPVGRRAMFRGEPPLPLVATTVAARRDHPERIAALFGVAEVLVCGDESVVLPDLLALLRSEHGVRRLVVEGGPRVNGAFFAAGLVDELFLTLASRIVGGRGRTIVESEGEPIVDMARLALVSVAPTPAEVFLRYRVVCK
jgi:riboflavin-specific deaminase-like protein